VELFLIVGFELVARRAGSDVIEVRRTAVPEILDVVDAATGAFLDRTAGAVLLLGVLLGPSQTTRWCGRAEDGGAVAYSARARLKAPTGRSWSSEPASRAATSGPWPSEPTTRRPKAAGARRTRTGEATLPRRARRAILAGARLAHRQVATHERLSVEAFDDFIGDAALGEFHEREPARTTSFPIDRHRHMRGLGNWREVCAKISFGCAVRQVADEQTDCHVYPRKGRLGGLRF
jgi:hypothetical protein